VNPVPYPRVWPAFCEMLGHPEWSEPGQVDNMQKLLAESATLTAKIDPIVATRDQSHWGAELDKRSIIWAPVATMTEVIEDPQMREMGWVKEVETSFGQRVETQPVGGYGLEPAG
jgi:crotonobetainyl-CoA:carnitine CoA-transferase CaiB-like acyl-CoA transferase